ncbi:hypothetical protein Trydic_g19182 [Trypoxylus dichotomus]
MNLSVVTLLVVGVVQAANGVLDLSEHVKARQKRWLGLIWRPGINWVQMVVGIGLPVEVQGTSVTWGAVLKSYYLLPTNSTQYTDPLAWIDVTSRKKRQASRWDMYSMMERFAESMGYENGRACLLRAICEIASAPLETKSGLLSEILDILLTPSSTNEKVDRHSDFEYHAAEELGKTHKADNCFRLFPDCSYSLIAEFTKSLLH